MASPGRPERNETARSFRQFRRFHHVINSDRVFGTHRLPWGYTLGPHQKLLACSKSLFYGAFSKPFYGGGEGGILCLGPWGLENGRKINVFRTTAVGCVYRQYVPEPTARLKWIRPDG